MRFASRLTTLHDAFLTLVLLLAFLAVVTGGAAPPWLIAAFPLALIGAYLFYRAGLANPSQNRWWNALIITVLLASAAEYLTSTRIDPMVIGVRFVLILIIIKAFSRQGPRDEFQLYALSFLTLAAASSFSEDLAYGIIFGLYVLCGTFGLALFHLKNEADRHLTPQAPRSTPFDGLYISTLAAISALIFASSLLIFFVFPRVGLGLFVEQSRESLSVLGFSEDISVGDHGAVRDNPAVVMRVEFEDGRPEEFSSFRWRTMTFDHYEQGDWSRTRRHERPTPYSRRRAYDLDFLYPPGLLDELSDEPRYRLQIYLEPLGTNVLPTLWPTRQVQLGGGDVSHLIRDTGSLTYDGYGDLRHTTHAEVGMSYAIEVAQAPPLDALIRQSGQELNERDARRYTQLPVLDPRVNQLASDITAGAPSNFERALAIGEYFDREFEYTLDLPEISGEPVEAFLFDTQRGHCEYFATSAVVLLRSVGVPARMVNGFLGGSWNEVGDYLTVRQGDAHAWVEVYVPELGWIPFDPTPPITSTFLERSGLIQFARDAHDAMRQAWLKWILEYDLQAQFSLFRAAFRTLSPASAAHTAEPDADDDKAEASAPIAIRPFIFWSGWLTLLVATFARARRRSHFHSIRAALPFVAAIFLGAIWTGWFQGWTLFWTGAGALSVALATLLPFFFTSPTQSPGVAFARHQFERIEARARRAGIFRRPDEGPAEFLDRLKDYLPDSHRSALHLFTRHYLSVRFGNRPLGPESRRAFKKQTNQALAALKTLKRESPPPSKSTR